MTESGDQRQAISTNDLDYEQADLERSGFTRYVAGVTDPILRALGDVDTGTTVIDLGCGNGEPALTLAARRPDLNVLGVDTSAAQVEAARAAAARIGSDNVRFEQMDMNGVELADGSVGAITSRMAALQFADVRSTAREIARLLRPGAAVSVGLWGPLDEHPVMRAMTAGLIAALGPERAPDLSGFEAFADDEVREAWLRDAGLTSVRTERVQWTVLYRNFDSWFELVQTAARTTPGGFYESLDEPGHAKMREHVRRSSEPLRRADGAYEIVVSARVVTGRR